MDSSPRRVPTKSISPGSHGSVDADAAPTQMLPLSGASAIVSPKARELTGPTTPPQPLTSSVTHSQRTTLPLGRKSQMRSELPATTKLPLAATATPMMLPPSTGIEKFRPFSWRYKPDVVASHSTSWLTAVSCTAP